MKFLRTFCLLSLLFFSLLIPAVAADQMVVIESISSQRDDVRGQETVNFKLNLLTFPKVFTIEGEKPRIVLDFADTSVSDQVDKVIEVNSKSIKRLRVGIHSGADPKTRIVIDLASGLTAPYEQNFDEQEKIFYVTVFDTAAKRSESLAVEESKGSEPESENTDKQLPESKEVKPASDPVAVIKLSAQEKKRLLPRSEFEQVDGGVTDPEKSKESGADYNYPRSEEVFGTSKEKAAAPAKKESAEKVAEQQPGKPQIFDIGFDDSSNKGEMVSFKLNDFYPPVVFGQEKDNPGVVCDFPDTLLSKNVPATIDCNGVYVKRIKTSSHKNPDKIRVVLELVPDKNYDLQQVFFKEDNSFVIIVNSFDEGFVPEEPQAQ